MCGAPSGPGPLPGSAGQGQARHETLQRPCGVYQRPKKPAHNCATTSLTQPPIPPPLPRTSPHVWVFCVPVGALGLILSLPVDPLNHQLEMSLCAVAPWGGHSGEALLPAPWAYPSPVVALFLATVRRTGASISHDSFGRREWRSSVRANKWENLYYSRMLWWGIFCEPCFRVIYLGYSCPFGPSATCGPDSGK